MSPRTLPLLLIAVAFAAVACGGSRPDSSPSAPTPIPTVPPHVALFATQWYDEQTGVLEPDFTFPVHPELAKACELREIFVVLNTSDTSVGVDGLAIDGDGYSRIDIGGPNAQCPATHGFLLPSHTYCRFFACFDGTTTGSYHGFAEVDFQGGSKKTFTFESEVLPKVSGVDPDFAGGKPALPEGVFVGFEPGTVFGGAATIVGDSLIVPSQLYPEGGTWANTSAFTRITPRGVVSSTLVWNLGTIGFWPTVGLVAATPDGSGFYATIDDWDFAGDELVRFRADLTPDPSFPIRNVYTSPVDGQGLYWPRTLDVTSAGAPGEHVILGMGREMLAFDAAGSLDTSFAGTGAMNPAPTWASTRPPNVIDAQGRITVGTWGGLGRVTRAGVLDSSFSWTGAASALALDADGSVLVAHENVLARLDETGGETPIATLPAGATIRALAVAADGVRLVGADTMPGLLRIQPDGSYSEDAAVGHEGAAQIVCGGASGACWEIGWADTGEEYVLRLAPP